MQLPFSDDTPERRAWSLFLLVVLEHMRRAGAFSRCELVAVDGPEISNALARGSDGAAVRRWQEYLLSAGQDLGSSGADGKFGPLTEKATLAVAGTPDVAPAVYAAALETEETFEFTGLSGDAEKLAVEAAAVLFPKE